jgi:hypothetical protein
MNLALEVPLLERRASLEQRLQRLLENARFNVRRCYAPLSRQILRQWRGAEICLIMDRTDIQADVSVLMLASPTTNAAAADLAGVTLRCHR